MNADETVLTDAMWARVEHMLPRQGDRSRRNRGGQSGRFDDACRSMVRRWRAGMSVSLSAPASKPALAA